MKTPPCEIDFPARVSSRPIEKMQILEIFAAPPLGLMSPGQGFRAKFRRSLRSLLQENAALRNRRSHPSNVFNENFAWVGRAYEIHADFFTAVPPRFNASTTTSLSTFSHENAFPRGTNPTFLPRRLPLPEPPKTRPPIFRNPRTPIRPASPNRTCRTTLCGEYNKSWEEDLSPSVGQLAMSPRPLSPPPGHSPPHPRPHPVHDDECPLFPTCLSPEDTA